MDINIYLKEKQEEIISLWHKAIMDTYPKDSGKFLIGNKNQFANPIGFTISDELPKIYAELINDNDLDILNRKHHKDSCGTGFYSG
ncbi:hypothetical protein ACFLSQ_06055 [Bacteroidota bacterium]